MKKKIMVDMDDVLVSSGFLYLINKFLNTNYVEEDFKNFYMQDIIPEEKKKNFFDYFLKYNLYDYSVIKDNCIEVLKELSKNYEIFICTAYIFKEIKMDSGIILKYKYDYLIKNFPFINPNNIIFTGNKDIVNCDIKIDDRIENLNGAEIKILFTAYHNKDISNIELSKNNIIRAKNWQDVKNIIKNN